MAFEIIAPTSPYRFSDPLVPTPEFTAADQVGAVEWASTLGTMAPATGDSSILSPLNITRTVTITATDTGTDPVTVATKTFRIEATCPFEADRHVEGEISAGFEPSLAEKGPPRFRVMARSAQWPLVFKIRRFVDYATLRDFLIANETYPFWYGDTIIGELRKVYQDSGLRRVGQGINWIDYAFQVRDYGYNPPTNFADYGPYASGDPPPLYDEPLYDE